MLNHLEELGYLDKAMEDDIGDIFSLIKGPMCEGFKKHVKELEGKLAKSEEDLLSTTTKLLVVEKELEESNEKSETHKGSLKSTMTNM